MSVVRLVLKVWRRERREEVNRSRLTFGEALDILKLEDLRKKLGGL